MNPTIRALMPFLLMMALRAPIKAHKWPDSFCNDYLYDLGPCPILNYEQLNQRCCGSESGGGKQLHCIITAEGVSVYACLQKQTIPAGHAMSFQPRHSPENIILDPCEPSGPWFEPNNRSSIDVHSSHCTQPRSRCGQKGQTRLCQGGGAADDRCGCAEGYAPQSSVPRHCRTGFGDGYPHCSCQKQPCPEGTARNMTPYRPLRPCPAEREEIDYTCYPMSPPPHPSSSPHPPHPSSTAAPPGKADDRLKWLWLLLIPVIVGFCYYLGTRNRNQ